MPQYMHWFVKHTVRTAMGRKDREREMTSVLLSSLFGDQVTPETVVKVCPPPCSSRPLPVNLHLLGVGNFGSSFLLLVL